MDEGALECCCCYSLPSRRAPVVCPCSLDGFVPSLHLLFIEARSWNPPGTHGPNVVLHPAMPHVFVSVLRISRVPVAAVCCSWVCRSGPGRQPCLVLAPSPSRPIAPPCGVALNPRCSCRRPHRATGPTSHQPRRATGHPPAPILPPHLRVAPRGPTGGVAAP